MNDRQDGNLIVLPCYVDLKELELALASGGFWLKKTSYAYRLEYIPEFLRKDRSNDQRNESPFPIHPQVS